MAYNHLQLCEGKAKTRARRTFPSVKYTDSSIIKEYGGFKIKMKTNLYDEELKSPF